MSFLVFGKGVEHLDIFKIGQLIELLLDQDVILGLIGKQKGDVNTILSEGRSLCNGVHWGDARSSCNETNLVFFVLEDILLDLELSVPEILEHTDWTLTHDGVAHIDFVFKMLCENASLGEIWVITVSFDNEIGRSFLVHW